MKKRPDRAVGLAAIRRSICSAYKEVKEQTFDGRRTEVILDDGSKAMMNFLTSSTSLKELPDLKAA